MSDLRIGCIGAGSIAATHAETLQALGANVVAVADIVPAARSSFANRFDVPNTYEDHRTMVAEAPIDLVVVAVPNANHEDCAVAAIEADLDVFVEKPLAHSLESAERIAAAERNSDSRVAVGFVRAFEPWVRTLRRKIDAGEFGTVYDLEAEHVRRRGIPQLGSWFTRKDVAGGGAVIDAGVHVIHLVLSLLGFPDVETVSATTGGNFGSKDDYTYLTMWGGGPVDEEQFDVDDYARAFVRTAEGTTLEFHFAWAVNGPPRKSIHVHGDDTGAVVSNEDGGPRARLYSEDDGALADTELQFADGSRFTAQWEYFTSVVEDERQHTRNTIEEGLAVQRVVDAIYESADAGREVVLDGS